MRIWKFKLSTLSSEAKVKQQLDMPKGAEILHVGTQRGEWFMWAICRPQAVMEKRTFYIVGTGWDMPEVEAPLELKHLGTISQMGGRLVWHIFEEDLSNAY